MAATYTYGNALIRKDAETPLFDGLGSERTVTNSSGAVQGTLTLSAFGQTVASTGSSTSAYQFGATSGYRTEGDAGLTLVGCRFYDAQVGRFISRDTYLDQKPYAYCDGDPVNATDPSGHCSAVLAVPILIEAGPIGWVILGVAVVVVAVVVLNEVRVPDSPTDSPGPGWGWRGSGSPETGKGAWTNPETGESLHPDRDHPPPIPPHWDYKPGRGETSQRIPLGGDTDNHGPGY